MSLTLLVLFNAVRPAISSEAVSAPDGAPHAVHGFAELAERVAPTTVYIQADKHSPMTAGLQQLAQDYALPVPGAQSRSASTGSGVIVEKTGIVVTNHHVVAGASTIVVTLNDKRQYLADLVGSDARTDVAVLQMRAKGPFEAAEIGDSDTLPVGAWVLAVGHPFDFQFTVTAGIVSARGRRNLARDEIQNYIQTDAAVNPGSSGGPLFDMAGQLVGINTAIYSPGTSSGMAQSAGISFAIPSNMAIWVANELRATGRVARPGIGVVTIDSPATPEDPRPGAEISRVVADGPAERAGLRRGDIIISVDQEPVGSSEDLRGIVLASGVDNALDIGFERGRAVRHVDVVTWDDQRVGETDETIPSDGAEWGGMVLATATEDRKARFGVAAPARGPQGVIVLGVRPGSPASTAGLARGDVLLEVQRTAVKDLDRFLELVEGRKSVLLLFWRGNGTNYAAIVP